jgi:CheY-like chemotaxis protein
MLVWRAMTPLPPPPGAAASTRVEREPEATATVLVIDDDLDIAEACDLLFTSAGYRVRIAHGGRDGLVALSEGTLPDCVVLDVDMPDMSGLEVAHRMLIHDAGQERIPIFVVSSRKNLPEIAARIGTPYFLAKGSARYAQALLATLALAILERRAPTGA